MTANLIRVSGVALAASLMLVACKPQRSPEYLAACEGPPLGNVEKRQAAMEAGTYNRRYDCIDKAVLAAEKERKAQWEAANTPEALAQRQAQREEQAVQDRARRQAEEEAERREVAARPPFVLPDVEINTATAQELSRVPSLGPDVVAQIVRERDNGRFRDWEDVVRRVAALSAAQTAAYASTSGLKVNGKSLSGAPPDARLAAAIAERYRRYYPPRGAQCAPGPGPFTCTPPEK